MKKRLHDRKRLLQFALSLCLILMSNYTSWGQQVIGSFPYMDGGFEGQSIGAITAATNGSATVWTKSAAGSTSNIVANASLARSGSKYAIGNLATGGSNRGLQTPTGTPPTAASHVIQFYYRNQPVGNIQAGIFGANGTIQVASTVSGWNKGVFVMTSATSANYAYVGRQNPTTAFSYDVDDVVVYAGTAADIQPPTVLASNPIASLKTSNQQTISWDPSTDTDFTGYLVVRGLSDPATAPNVNGIYAKGNTLAAGETVVYLGAAASFVDLDLAEGTTYFYRIYTVDKAFNYSATGLSFSSATTAPITIASDATVQASGLTLGNVTGSTLEISWTAGNGTNSLVLVKAASAVDTDPTDGGIYTENLAFGSGTQIGTGNYAVYIGTGNSATITGLTRGITYFVKVYTFNVNVAGSQNYLTTTPASGSILNLPYQNSFSFNTTSEGFTTLTRATAVQATESSRGTLRIITAGANRNSTIVGLNTSYARVDVTTNKYAHITLKNTTTTNNNIQLVSSAVTFNPRQIITTNDADYKTYDFDLSALTGDQYPTINISVKDTWSGTATYAVDDTVIQSNGTYKNLTGVNTTIVPRLDATNWVLVGTEGGLLDVTNFIYIDSIVFDNVLPTLVSNGTGGGAWGIGATWAGGVVPGVNDNVNIVGSDAVNSTGTRNCNQLSIAVGSSLTLAGGSLTVKNGIINNGTITVDNNANLIQTAALDTNSGSGTATVKRNSASIQLYDYTLWSSPVNGQDLRTFSSNTLATRFYTYNTASNQYNVVDFTNALNFASATGYLIRAPNDWALNTPTTFNGVFNGVLNNGPLSKALNYTDDARSYNLVGNPYPSTIDANAFITDNTANIENTLYFWRKTNGATSSAYATYNPAGGTGTAPTATSETPNGTIQVGQGFFVKAKSASTLNFKNAMRLTSISTQFFRTNTERNRIWLNLTNNSGVFSQMLVSYMAEATQGVDSLDGKYINDAPIALTSIINAEEYTIQGRALPFATTDTVPLGFKTNAAGNYTIAIDHVDGLFSTSQTVFLKDNLLNTVVDLSAGSYSFASAIGTFNSRFEVVYQSTLAVTNPTFTANSVIAYSANGVIRINSGSTVLELVRVYDLQGRLMVEKKQINASEIKLSTTAKNQVLLVEIIASNGSKITKKIIQ